MSQTSLNFMPGFKLEAKDFNEKWHTARVVETDWIEREVLIHFDKWSSRYDEWIPMDSSRLRVLQVHSGESRGDFKVGDRILATWSNGKKYPAKVNAMLANDKYDVLFDDGYSKILKTCNMFKLPEGSSIKNEDENSYIGSKQERRDKKRKHTISELFNSPNRKRIKNESDKAYKKQDILDINNIKAIIKAQSAYNFNKTEVDSGSDTYNKNKDIIGGLEEEGVTFIGNLRVEIEGSTYKCPIPGCTKNFRKENLLQMHVKHYHPEYLKFLGSTPNVADLAYARTVGESVEDFIPQRSRICNTQSFQVSQEVPQSIDTHSSETEIESKFEQKLAIEHEDSIAEDNFLDEINSCTMSPETLFNMRFKEEKNHVGLKTLLPVRQISTSAVGDSEQNSTIPSDQKSIAVNDKGKGQRKKSQQYHCISGEKIRKQRRISDHDANYDHFEDSLLDGDDSMDINYKCSNDSNNRSEIDNTDSIQSESSNITIKNEDLTKLEKLSRDEIINCTCGIYEEDGLMIQCDLCLCWQHGYCNSIEKEKDVPEKYICYICQNAYRQRNSKKHFHDQDWLQKGKLPSLKNYSTEILKLNERSAMLKRSYDLVAALTQIQDLLHSLRVKLNIAQSKDHPKLYLWAKNWSKVKIPSLKNEPVPIMQMIKIENSSDNRKGNIREKSEFSFSLRKGSDQKLITSDIELMKILEEDNNQAEDQNHDSLVKRHDSHESGKPNLLGQCTAFEKSNESQADLTQENIKSQPVIPEPEALIDPIECKLRLLEHFDHYQDYINLTLTFIEAQISSLENINAVDKPNTNQHMRTKETVQMILHDLETIQKLAALC